MTLTDQDRQALIENYLDKSRDAVENVKFLLENDKLALAVNQIYYGIFYLLSAVALRDQFETSKHKQLIGWFNKTYIKTGIIEPKYSKLIQKAYDNRMEGDYNVLSSFAKDQVAQAFAEMQEVLAAIAKLL